MRIEVGIVTGVLAVLLGTPSGDAQQQRRGPGAQTTTPQLPDPATLSAAETRIFDRLDWPSPELGDGPFEIESAVPEHRNLRVVVVARLEQPWSLTWLPGGDMLVTERPGRLRIIRKGILDPKPVDGVPAVRAQGLQGLMDVVLHPRFAERRQGPDAQRQGNQPGRATG